MPTESNDVFAHCCAAPSNSNIALFSSVGDERPAYEDTLECSEHVLTLLARCRDIASNPTKHAPLLCFVRKHPEIFCRTFTILRSRSARLLSNGTLKSCMNRKTASRCLSSRSTRFLPLLCLGLPFLPVLIGGGFAARPASSNRW